MKTNKKTIKDIILGNQKDFKRFEMMENFAKYADDSDDIKFLLKILRTDKSSVIRHEAAAQLLKIEQRQPWLIEPVKKQVIEELLHVVLNDNSLVAKHESVEALSYIGDSNVLIELNKLLKNESATNELLETVEIARDTIEYRIIKNIPAAELSSTIIKEGTS